MHGIHIDILARQQVLEVRTKFIQSQFDFDIDEFGNLSGRIVDQHRCRPRLLSTQEE